MLYAWHPWFERQVLIVGALIRGGSGIFRCQPNDDSSRALEIPQWMFDAATCCSTRLSSTPVVTCGALCDVRRLLDAAERIPSIPVVQAEHPIPNAAGGAYAIYQSDQLKLFPPTAPLRWRDVPAEARERTVSLLARLIRQHVHARHAAGVRDE